MGTETSGYQPKSSTPQMLVKTNVSGPGRSGERIAKGFGRRCETVEAIRRRSVESGFDQTSKGKHRSYPTVEKLRNGKREVQVIGLRLGTQQKGRSNWTLRQSVPRVVKPKIAPAIVDETTRLN